MQALFRITYKLDFRLLKNQSKWRNENLSPLYVTWNRVKSMSMQTIRAGSKTWAHDMNESNNWKNKK